MHPPDACVYLGGSQQTDAVTHAYMGRPTEWHSVMIIVFKSFLPQSCDSCNNAEHAEQMALTKT
jgi:hypothetical protein